MPGIRGACRASRSTTCAVGPRARQGLQADEHAAVIDRRRHRCRRSDEAPTPATAGSAGPLRRPAAAGDIAANEMSVEASVIPKIEAGIVLWEVAFGRRVEVDGQPMTPDRTSRVRSGAQHDPQAAAVAAHHPRSSAPSTCRSNRPRGRPLGAHEARADHRGDGQGHHGRDHDRERERHRELPEQPADDAVHEQERDEGGDQRDADRDDGEADLPRALRVRPAAVACPASRCDGCSRS